MDWKVEMEEAQRLAHDRRFEQAVEKYKLILEQAEHEPKVYYWALKQFADLVGFLYAKDYFHAIDLYQQIINEYDEEDGLYEWCQVDMAKTYLYIGMDMMESYESMTEFLEPINSDMASYIEKIKEKREDFLTERAEVIYKSRI